MRADLPTGCAGSAGKRFRPAKKRHSRVDGQICPSTLLFMVRPPARSPYETSTNRRACRLRPRRARSGCAGRDHPTLRRLVQVSCGWPRVGRASDLRVHRGRAGRRITDRPARRRLGQNPRSLEGGITESRPLWSKRAFTGGKPPRLTRKPAPPAVQALRSCDKTPAQEAALERVVKTGVFCTYSESMF